MISHGIHHESLEVLGTFTYHFVGLWARSPNCNGRIAIRLGPRLEGAKLMLVGYVYRDQSSDSVEQDRYELGMICAFSVEIIIDALDDASRDLTPVLGSFKARLFLVEHEGEHILISLGHQVPDHKQGLAKVLLVTHQARNSPWLFEFLNDFA